MNSGIGTISGLRVQPDNAQYICALNSLKLVSVANVKVHIKRYLAKLNEPISKHLVIITEVSHGRNQIENF